uniref:Uncharacterized protein n=1 Tax=Pseudo-nitzschia australis TaxID=44445 RepID=A0A7S4ENQ5_9STRA|mmetsp:Transcript_4978/g.11065  ORF Transcript_4978/g.11065 Transcript_4978/m.11065 type:complete len:427 (-) Transcript_4978:43-1323(-)
MWMVRQILLQAWTLQLLSFAVVDVEAFASLCIPVSTAVQNILYSHLHAPLYPCDVGHPCRKSRNKSSVVRLWAHRRRGRQGNASIQIRDWRSNGEEPEKIYNFLLRQEKEQVQRAEFKYAFFDPEGSLELDVLNQRSLEESYSKEDGGCFLVAVTGDEDEDRESVAIVGTLGMITGTKIVYQSSGSSQSGPEVTAAIRRVCASWPDNDDDTTEHSLTKQVSTMTILGDLIQKGEQQALQSGATHVIGLAYPEMAVTEDYCETSKSIIKPSVDLFEALGYRISDQQLSGVNTVQYEKNLIRNQLATKTSANADVAVAVDFKSGAGRWIILATTIGTLLSLGLIIFNLYSNVFGIEQLWGSSDNAGMGTSLSTQNLQELIRDEQLGRSGLDEGIDSYATRQWEDLSPEELREEQALMKIIQGQSIRSK